MRDGKSRTGLAGDNMLAALPCLCSVLRASYTTSLPEHISELMPLYMDPHLNFEWNQRSALLPRLTNRTTVLASALHRNAPAR